MACGLWLMALGLWAYGLVGLWLWACEFVGFWLGACWLVGLGLVAFGLGLVIRRRRR